MIVDNLRRCLWLVSDLIDHDIWNLYCSFWLFGITCKSSHIVSNVLQLILDNCLLVLDRFYSRHHILVLKLH